MTVLVTGGAGYIGSHTCLLLLEAGYETVVADNLSNASEESLRRVERLAGRKLRFVKGDICDAELCERLLRENPDIEAVIHFAALKAVGESVEKPLAYHANNLIGALTLLRALERHGVKRFIFSSSATVYGNPAAVPVREDFPTSAANPYGRTKLFIEQILADICAADAAFSAANLRYFNPIGAHASGLIGEDPNGIPNNLLPYVAQVAVGKLDEVRVFGNDYPTPDGTGVRDYIHVTDLARGHLCALERVMKSKGLFLCNLGTGKGYSVLEVIEAFSKACKKPIAYRIEGRRAGDVAEIYADPSKAKRELGWQAMYDLDRMCADTWRWQRDNPNGYAPADGRDPR
ncbi:MAG: UDP-glucose 4-epimerase GalE [Clostridiales Family XIII bacterium]|jgi:UDP-glucose 4-epimerase|nr:UDP-glucose 4-epimerase GalE [Clostridiales Family XIII bacterium]